MSGHPHPQGGAFTRALKELAQAHIPYRVMTFEAKERSAEEVARETNFPLPQVVKTLLVQGASKKYYLALCPGDRQVNLKALARALNEKGVDMAAREDVPKVTGYFIGGVSPLATHRSLPVVMEASILTMPEIAISAGQWGCQAVLRPSDLRDHLGPRAMTASLCDIVNETNRKENLMSEYFYSLDARKYYKDLMEAQKDMFQAFINFNSEIFEKESALPKKVKELIAIGVAHTTQCPYCIEAHVKAAKKAGATTKEIAEAIFVAAALRAGGAFAHSTISMGALKGMEGK